MIHDLVMLVQNRPESKKNTTPYCSTWFFGWTWFLPHGWFGKQTWTSCGVFKGTRTSNLPQNTVLFLSRIPTKHNSCMWSYSDENAVCIRVIAWANHGEFTTTAHFSTANWQVRIVQRVLTDQDSTNEKQPHMAFWAMKPISHLIVIDMPSASTNYLELSRNQGAVPWAPDYTNVKQGIVLIAGSSLWPKLFWSGKHGFNMKESTRGISSPPFWEQWVWPSYALYL